MSDVKIKVVAAAQTRPLRQQVLRPHQTIEELNYPGDDAPTSIHFAAFFDNEIIGIASLYLNSAGSAAKTAIWQLRGMAVAPRFQGKGVGSQLIQKCVDHVVQKKASRLWCNARETALEFYRARGFRAQGEAFDIPGTGTHFIMSMDL